MWADEASHPFSISPEYEQKIYMTNFKVQTKNKVYQYPDVHIWILLFITMLIVFKLNFEPKFLSTVRQTVIIKSDLYAHWKLVAI